MASGPISLYGHQVSTTKVAYLVSVYVYVVFAKVLFCRLASVPLKNGAVVVTGIKEVRTVDVWSIVTMASSSVTVVLLDPARNGMTVETKL